MITGLLSLVLNLPATPLPPVGLMRVQTVKPISQYKRLNPGLPQTIPFKYYSTWVYNFGELGRLPEDQDPHWQVSGPDGAKWGYPEEQAAVDLGMAAKAAWGWRWWGLKLGQKHWVERSSQLMNLVLVNEGQNLFLAREFVTKDQTTRDCKGASSLAPVTGYVPWLAAWPDSELAPRMRERVASALGACEERTASTGAEESARMARFASAIVRAKRALPAESERARKFLDKWSVDARPGIGGKCDLVDRCLVTGSGLEKAASSMASEQKTVSAGAVDQFGRIGFAAHESVDAGLLLMRAGASLHQRDMFERGAAALKWSLNLLYEPTLRMNEIGPATGVRMGGMVGFDPKTGKLTSHSIPFELGPGALLAGFAEALDEFGGMYVDASGWMAGIDGCRPGGDGAPVSLLTSNPRPYSGEHEVRVVSPGKPHKTVQAKTVASICRIDASVIDGKRMLVAVPGAVPITGERPKVGGTFTLVGRSWSKSAKLLGTGLGCRWPSGVTEGQFLFKGRINGAQVAYGPVLVKRP